MPPSWVGLDVAADSLVACVLDEEGRVRAEQSLTKCPTEVARFIEANAPTSEPIIGIEAGGLATSLTRKLRDAGYRVHAFETRQASRFLAIRQNKTDRNDARGIAEIVRIGRGTVAEVYVKSTECQQLRSKLALREKLVRHRMAGESAIGAVFRLNGGRLGPRHSAGSLRRTVMAELSRIQIEESLDLSADVMPVLDICESIRLHLEATDRELLKFAREHSVCARFMQIPGVGFLTAISVLSAIEDPERFSQIEDVGAYFGLVPKIRQSGQSSRHVGITRMGNKMTRTHLVAAASAMLRQKSADCDLKDWAVTLRERAGFRTARTALARKLATVMVSMWKSGEPFQPRRRAGVARVSIAPCKMRKAPLTI
ncbi:MAG TPA: IS110 family transposase [Burkholderiales bacterium]|jgi:transposase|nr:IS110 family transposase [Burkholderiales bacterium]